MRFEQPATTSFQCHSRRREHLTPRAVFVEEHTDDDTEEARFPLRELPVPGTARLSQRFYEKLGDDLAKELGDWVQRRGRYLPGRPAGAERAELRPVRREG